MCTGDRARPLFPPRARTLRRTHEHARTLIRRLINVQTDFSGSQTDIQADSASVSEGASQGLGSNRGKLRASLLRLNGNPIVQDH